MLALLLLLATVAACSGTASVPSVPPDAASPILGVDALTATKLDISVRRGGTFSIVVPSNPDLSYHWRLVHDKTRLEWVAQHHVSANGAVWASNEGLDVFVFRALAPGETSVGLQTIGPDQQTMTASQTYLVTVSN